jgi:hypothetical protein
MVLHLGNDFFVTIQDVLMILDYEEASVNEDTSIFLKDIPEVDICEEMKPESIIIVENGSDKKAYISPISSATLLKRSTDGGLDILFSGGEN